MPRQLTAGVRGAHISMIGKIRRKLTRFLRFYWRAKVIINQGGGRDTYSHGGTSGAVLRHLYGFGKSEVERRTGFVAPFALETTLKRVSRAPATNSDEILVYNPCVNNGHLVDLVARANVESYAGVEPGGIPPDGHFTPHSCNLIEELAGRLTSAK